ncbi:MAG: hypothetical protein ACR2PL_20880 [Dehalococcoidia bacterium]
MTGISPFLGASIGGTSVTVTGGNFQSGAAVMVRGRPARGVSVGGGGSNLTAIVPAHSPVGDVNGDGQVNAVDAPCILRSVAGPTRQAGLPLPRHTGRRQRRAGRLGKRSRYSGVTAITPLSAVL